MKRIVRAFAVLCTGLSLCSPGIAQIVTGNITVRAQDSSGAVIPGVEVTISSPAMIGGSRKELTDETGSYRFTLLPPGTYRVSFALAGFRTLNVDGVLLTAGATATTTGTLEVSATSEEITVTSEAPTIDLESATIGVNINQKLMDDLPWSHSVLGMGMMIPGVFSTSLDISNSLFGTSAVPNVRSGGRSGGNLVVVDGLLWCQSYSNYGSFEEVNVSTNAKGADQMNSGVSIALIPKTGGNSVHASFTAKYQNGSMQSNNVSQELLDQGYSVGSNKFTHFTDYWGDIGGPIIKDKFWFYGAYRAGYQGTFIPGYRTAVGGPLGVFYTTLRNQSAKLTYQLTEKQKLDVFLSMNTKNQPYRGASALVPAEATNSQGSWFGEGPVLTYTNTIDSKTSLSVKILRGGHWTTHDPLGFNGPGFEGLGPNIAQLINGSLVSQRIPTMSWVGFNNVGVRISDTTTGATDGGWGASGGNANYERPIRWQENIDFSRFATIAGKKHELKVGYMGLWDKDYSIFLGSPYQEQFIYRSMPSETCPNSGETCDNLFQHPYRVTVYDSPSTTADIVKYKAAYVNDKITFNRKLTLNAGLRWDWSTSMLPPQGNDGSGPWSQRFYISKNQDYITNADGTTSKYPVYSLWSPRLSFAYDVLGNGKIAIKGSYGWYTSPSDLPGGLLPGPGEPSNGGNPISTASCTYNNWDGSIPFNAKKNFGPDGLMGTSDDINLSGSCAKTTVLNGQIVPLTIYHFDPNLKTAYVSEFTAGLEIGFNQNYSLRFNIQRKFDRNGSKTVNVNTPYDAYTEVTSADDPGLDGRICTGGAFDKVGVATPCVAGGTNWDADNNPHGRLIYYSVPTAYPGRTDTNVLYQATCGKTHEGCASYTAYTVTFNKNYSNRWQFVTAYDIDMAHSNPNNPTTPNNVIANALLAPVTWNQSFKMSGTYGVPDIPLFHFKLTGLQYASSFLTQSGAWYGRTAQVNDIRGSAQSISVDPHVGRFPWVRDWDQSFRKKFNIGEKQSLEFTWELYNSLNSNMVSAWRSTSSAASTYLQPDMKDASGKVVKYGVPYRPSVILTPRIYEWGVAYRF